MGSGIIISETEPTKENRYTWVKPIDGTIEFYELDEGVWVLTNSVEHAEASHTHDGLDQLPDIITLLNNGVTGQKTVGSYKFTFNHGVLVNFEEV